MNPVKIYQNVDAQKDDVNFGISKMEDIYTKRNGRVDEPHRHNFYTVLIFRKASGLHKIDFNTYDLAEKQVFFVAPGQVHQVIEHEKSIGFAMTFSSQFLVENSISISFIDRLNLFQNYGQSPPLLPDQSAYQEIEYFTEKIYALFHSTENMKHLSIGAFLKLILIQCNNLCAMNPLESEVDSTGDNLIKSFKTAVDREYKKEHSTSYYAHALFITPDHLNRTIKSKMGTTAKDYVQARIITEAKRLIYFSDLSNKEIAFELGFQEPAHFSAFFKKHTQLSPLNFKKNEQKQ